MENIELDIIREMAEKETVEVFIDKNLDDKYILGAIKEGRPYYFNSRYNDRDMVEDWCSQTELDNFRTVAVVFGLANGEYIRTLRKKNKDMAIIVFEPSYSVAYACMGTAGIDYVYNDGKCAICVGEENYTLLNQLICANVTYEGIDYAKLLETPNYENIFPEQLAKVRDLFLNCISKLCIDRNTVLKFGTEINVNIARNIEDCIEQYNIADLISEFKNIDCSDIPAVVVAAGPSLDKNVEQLKHIKGKALIISTDTALNTLSKKNIIPDIAITVDPHKPLSLFDKDNMSDISLVYSLSANSNVRDIHNGKRIYQAHNGSIMDKYETMFGKEKIMLETGGSVACDSFSLARVLGFKTVIFIGLDLACTDSKIYAENSYGDSKSNKLRKDISEYLQVEDIYGNMVPTVGNLDWYRVWFEQIAEKYKDIKFIDATEGGAKIKGMEIMTLGDAVETYCSHGKNIDFEEIIDSIDTYYTEEEQNFIWKDLVKLPECLKEIREKIKKGILAYDRLDEFNRRQKYTGREFETVIGKISEINDWISCDSMMVYLHMYAAKEDYEVKEHVYKQQSSQYEEFKLIVENGKKMLKAYVDATYQVEKDMEDTIQKAKEKAED